jgi:hypothetical protein
MDLENQGSGLHWTVELSKEEEERVEIMKLLIM